MKRLFTKERTRQAGVVLVVVVTLALLVAALSYVFYPKDNSPECGMIDPEAHGFLGEAENSLDVILVGDSRVYTGFSPMEMWHEFGFTSYDCASPGQQMPYTYTMLKRAFENQRPKVVVFETDSLLMRFRIEDAAFRLMADYVPFFEYHSRWKNLSLADFSSPIRHTWTDPCKGFVIDKVINTEMDPIVEDAVKYRMDGLARYVNVYMGIFVRMCREIGAIPLFVSAPSVNATDEAHHAALQALADQYDMDFLDLNDVPDEVGIDWMHDTTDGGEHLNYFGAVKCSHYLGAYLQKTYDLPNHQGDAAYASWDEGYTTYLDLVKGE